MNKPQSQISNELNFISSVVRVLNNFNSTETKVDIPFMLSPLYNSIGSCKTFMNDVSDKQCSIVYFEDMTGGYTNGHLEIKTNNNNYELLFELDRRPWNYCSCTSDDYGYNTEHNCCGDNCDWDAPSYSLKKTEFLFGDSFNGKQSDYWKFEKEFVVNQ